MSAFRFVALTLACLTLTACSKTPPSEKPADSPKGAAKANPRELIVAKWQRTDGGKTDIIEFVDAEKWKDGEGLWEEGVYKFTDSDTIEYQGKTIGKRVLTKTKVQVTPAELTLTIIDSQSKSEDSAPWTRGPDDNLRKNTTEKYKKIQ